MDTLLQKSRAFYKGEQNLIILDTITEENWIDE